MGRWESYAERGQRIYRWRGWAWFALGKTVVWVALAATAPAVEPWQTRYMGAEAQGPTVLALWQFLPGAEAQGLVGAGHDLSLRGRSKMVSGGRFGSCLESFAADSGNGVVVANSSRLTPSGAFTIELWIKAKPALDRLNEVTLLDKMYIDYRHSNTAVECQRDYALKLTHGGPGVSAGQRVLVAVLGFGESVARFTSSPARYESGSWHHVAFSYDGAGRGRFYRDGVFCGEGFESGRAGIVAGERPLVIGDRIGGTFSGFPGYIDQVRITSDRRRFFSQAVTLAVTGRTVYRRHEPGAALELVVRSHRKAPLAGARLSVQLAGKSIYRGGLATLVADQPATVRIPLATGDRVGSYAVSAVVEDRQQRPLTERCAVAMTLVGRPLPHQMPVVMWGAVNLHQPVELDRMQRLGFTHSLGLQVDAQRIFRAGDGSRSGDPSLVARNRRLLNFALAQGQLLAANLGPGWALRSFAPELRRIGRDGKPTAQEWFALPSGRRDICALCAEARSFAYNVGVSIARDYGGYPALDAALINSEVRDATQVCFHAWDRAAYRAESGGDIPPQVQDRHGVSSATLADFPDSRVVVPDHPLLKYYRWFWKHGDGWNSLHREVHRGLRSEGRNDIWTWFDPATRAPSVWGNGDGLDVVGQWTYSYPDPLRVGWATDRLFAMARGASKPQRVMKMTQLIWYRSETAPRSQPGEAAVTPRGSWEERFPEASFITIAPDHLRLAFWSKLSRPIHGIMYHGWGSLVDLGNRTGYCFTNPHTQRALAEMIHRVVKPLGPTLLQVPDVPADVGLLESFSAQVFAGKSSGSVASQDMHLTLQYAQLQPKVLFEEGVTGSALEGLRVLALSDCDVLTEPVVARIREFQSRGGIVVSDGSAPDLIHADVTLPRAKRTGNAAQDKATVLAKAAELRGALDSRYERYVDSSNPEVVTRLRRYAKTDYLFAINDRRRYGDYVGGHGMVMEKGQPAKAQLTLRRGAGVVYDLVAGTRVPSEVVGADLQLDCQLDPGEGRLFMITDRPIAAVKIDAPDETNLGEHIRIEVGVVDAAGTQVDAVVPVSIELTDPRGRQAEASGYYGAAGGGVQVNYDFAPNDTIGKWHLQVRELASGTVADHHLQVRP
ncbi:MAG: LamG domain-containing protein [Planctomycetota bacterium]|nr:LamG domain-containing protein [Planctomycetota bacterium]